MATLLTICQDVSDAVGFDAPSTVYGSSDASAKRLLAMANREGRDLASAAQWQRLTKEHTWTSLAAEDQGSSAYPPSDLGRILGDTVFDRSGNQISPGPITAQRWQALKATFVPTIEYQHRIRGNALMLIPAPAAGLTLAYEYLSKNWVLADDGTTYRDRFGADSDTIILPEEPFILGVIWRYRQALGLDYQRDEMAYREARSRAIATDQPAAIVSAGRSSGFALPYATVPEGSW